MNFTRLNWFLQDCKKEWMCCGGLLGLANRGWELIKIFFAFVMYFASKLTLNLYEVTKQYLFSLSCRMVCGLAVVPV